MRWVVLPIQHGFLDFFVQMPKLRSPALDMFVTWRLAFCRESDFMVWEGLRIINQYPQTSIEMHFFRGSCKG